MKTDQLIRALAADRDGTRLMLGQRLAAGMLAGAAVSLLLLLVTLGLRRNLGAAAADPRFLLKFPVTLGLALAAAGITLRLARPGAAVGPWGLALLVGPALLLLGVGAELAVMPPATWMPRLVGHNARLCVVAIPLLAAPVLVALVAVLKQGAPTRPQLAGAMAGLVAGGIGAAIYALHCSDDSPLFVATWYGIALAALMLIGAAAGRRFLRW